MWWRLQGRHITPLPHCRTSLPAELASVYGQRGWKGLYCVIIEDNAVHNNFKEKATAECVVVEFRDGKPPALFFKLEFAGVQKMKDLFESLSASAVGQQRLSEISSVRLADGVLEIVLESVRREPSRTLTVNNGRFHWVHTPEGWLECAELISGLRPGTHQYTDYGAYNDIEIVFSLYES